MKVSDDLVSKNDFAAYVKLNDELMYQIEHSLIRILAAVCTRNGNPLDFRGMEPHEITPSTVAVTSDTRNYALGLQKCVDIHKRIGALAEKLKPSPVAEPAKPEPGQAATKHRLAAALNETTPAANQLATK